MDSTRTTIAQRFRRRLASGLVVLVPIVVTIAVLRFLFGLTSGIFLPFVDPAAVDWPPWARALLSIGILIVVVYLLGAFAANFVGRKVISLGESLVLRVPIVKVVYSATKQVAAAFEKRESRAFKSVVYVEFPHPGMRALGFVTGKTRDTDGGVWNTVFIPTTPNITTGYLQVVPEGDLISTGFNIEEGIKMVMSLGVLVPDAGMTGKV